MKEAEKDFREVRNVNNAVGEAAGRNEILKQVSIIGAVALVAFLLGFLPMWLTARGYENELNTVKTQHQRSVLQNDLGTAAIYARRGEFEQARQQTSDFFTKLRAEFDREAGAFNAQQREVVQSILAQRDETITQLARNDVMAVDRLTDLYFAFMQLKNPPAPPETK